MVDMFLWHNHADTAGARIGRRPCMRPEIMPCCGQVLVELFWVYLLFSSYSRAQKKEHQVCLNKYGPGRSKALNLGGSSPSSCQGSSQRLRDGSSQEMTLFIIVLVLSPSSATKLDASIWSKEKG